MKTIKMVVMAILVMAFAGVAQAALTKYDMKEFDPTGSVCEIAYHDEAVANRRGYRLEEVTQEHIKKCNEVKKILATRPSASNFPMVKKAAFVPWWKKR
jgi:hypothetical protein